MDRLGRNPFTPDFDVPPPVLAGRERELSVLSHMTAELDAGISVRTVVLYGPRGNGKTALLNSSKLYKPKGTNIRIVQTLAQALRSSKDLASVLLGQKETSKAATSKLGGSLKLFDVGVSAERESLGTQTSPSVEAVVQELSRRKRIKSPTLLMLDEAHDLDREVGRMAFAIASRMKAKKIPFGLLLAGTPGIRRRLGEFDIFFDERAQLVRVSRLDDEATRKALFEPFESAGCSVVLESDMVCEVLDWTQNYPYFIQELGSMLFNAAKTQGDNQLTGDLLATVKREFDLTTEQMYGNRIDEIVRKGLIRQAVAIAEGCQKGAGSISRKDLYDSVESWSDTRSPEDVLDELVEFGYIWVSDDSNQRYEAGIPSLMSNILSKRQELPL